MATALALQLLNEVAATLGTTVKTPDVKSAFTAAHVSAVCRYGKSVGRATYDFASVLNEPTPTASKTVISAAVSTETDAEIDARLRERFEALEVMSHATAVGINRALIVSGAPGLGKSFGIEQKVNELTDMGAINSTYVKGYVRPLSMFRLMYENRHSNNVIVFDDADSVFADDVALNLLKAACDSSKQRRISWMSEISIEDEDGEKIPKTFEFQGNIIFITNYDFDSMISRGTRMAPHFEALISRALYLDLGLKTNRDYYVRVQQVVNETDMMAEFNAAEKKEIMDFVEANQLKFRDFSLRMVLKLGSLYRMGGNWQSLARMTLLK